MNFVIKIYGDGRHKIPVFAHREIEEKNFNPMCWHLLDKKNLVQVLVCGIGGLRWINIYRCELREVITAYENL